MAKHLEKTIRKFAASVGDGDDFALITVEIALEGAGAPVAEIAHVLHDIAHDIAHDIQGNG